MVEKKSSYLIFTFLLSWFILNLIQSIFTGISNDEAYYWMYSRFLEWGYFDHPPAIAAMIKIGYAIIPSEAGVRVLITVISLATLYFLYLLCKPTQKDFLLFALIFLSLPLVHVGGFLATPDIPFVFFTTIFLFVIKQYLENDNAKDTILLTILFACLVYSKYHGILVIFFTIIANLKILTRKTFWIATIGSLILFIPHLYWQYEHAFPSIKYHLFERSPEEYKINFTLEYLGGQVLILGPLTGLLLLFVSFKAKTETTFERVLKFNLAGIFLFFLLSSFKSRIEANWTSAAFIPLIILSFNYLKNSDKIKKWFIGLAIPSIVLILVARGILMMDTIPFGKIKKNEFYGWGAWAKQIEEKAGELPVVFMNSYQKASKYTFYTGKTAHSLNNFMYRKNQFDIWPIEDSLQGKKVFLIPNYVSSNDTFRNVFDERTDFVVVENFRSYNKIKIERLVDDPLKVKASDSIIFKIRLKNTGSYDTDFTENKDLPSQLSINFYYKGEYQSTQNYPLKTNQILKEKEFIQEIKFVAPEKPGKYFFRIAIQTGWLPMGLNSDLIVVEVF